MVRCDSLTFGTADLNAILQQLDPVDGEATAALNFAASLGGPTDLVTDDYEWMIGDDTPERLVVLGIPAAPNLEPTQYAIATVHRDGGDFGTKGR